VAERENDPAFEPLIEAGQGESEGFEEAERELEENATHGDGRGFPEEDIPEPEEATDAEIPPAGHEDY
jgi:hypothetical protein